MSENRDGNSVFTAQQAQMQGFSTRNVMKDDFGLEVPVEAVPLPSEGKIYSADSSSHNRETIEIRAMTAKEEDILTSRALIKKGTVITELIKSCLVNSRFLNGLARFNLALQRYIVVVTGLRLLSKPVCS